jgi:hypothetical protein
VEGEAVKIKSAAHSFFPLYFYNLKELQFFLELIYYERVSDKMKFKYLASHPLFIDQQLGTFFNKS